MKTYLDYFFEISKIPRKSIKFQGEMKGYFPKNEKFSISSANRMCVLEKMQQITNMNDLITARSIVQEILL